MVKSRPGLATAPGGDRLRSDHTFEDILKAAERLLSSAKTLDEMSVRRIAQDAGVNVSTIAAFRDACPCFSKGEIGRRRP